MFGLPALLVTLFSFLGNLFGSIATFVTSYFTRKLSISLTYAAGVTAILAAFVTVCLYLINSLIGALPSDVQNYIAIFLPSNTEECLTAVIGAQIYSLSHDFQQRILQARTGV